MEIVAQEISGVRLLQLDLKQDERGYFARTFCREQLARLGIEAEVAQANMSMTLHRGTLRGLHHQLAPSAETKLVMCLRGAIHDLVLDLREDEPTHGRSFAAELSQDNHRVMVVPPGCAHGFLTLTDDVVVFYLVSAAYDPAVERGVRWNDPAFDLDWPFAPLIVSARDRNHPWIKLAGHRAAA